MPTTMRSASSDAAAFELHSLALDSARRFLEMEDDAMLLVQRAHEVADLRDPRIRSIGRFSGATTWTSISRARRDGGDFESDEARAQTRPPGAPSLPAR